MSTPTNIPKTPMGEPEQDSIEVKIDKSLQFQVNWLNIAQDISIKAQTKNSSQNFEFSFLP